MYATLMIFLNNMTEEQQKLAQSIKQENETKTELLPFCQFFSFGIKID